MKWIFAAVAAIVLLAIVAMAAVPWLVDTPRVQSLIASTLSQTLGRPVKFRAVSVKVLPLPSVELTGLEVADDPRFGSGSLVTLDRGLVRLRLWPLLTGRIELGDLILKQPLISLVQSSDGRWNFASLGMAREGTSAPRQPGHAVEPRPAGPGPLATLVSRIRIEDGVVTYAARAAGSRPRATDYRLHKLNVVLTGGPSKIGFEGSTHLEPGDLVVKFSEGVVTLDGARSLQEAALRGRVKLEGKDIKGLMSAVAGPGLGMSGGLDGTLALAGTVGAPRATGEILLSDAKVVRTDPRCPRPEERTLALGRVQAAVEWGDARLTVRPLTASPAGGAVTSAVVALLDASPRAQLTDLSIKAVSLDRVLVDFLCQAYAVTGPLDLTGAFTFRTADPLSTVSGDGRFAVGKGKVVGRQALALLDSLTRAAGTLGPLLGGDAPGASGATPSEYESITGTFRVDNGVVTSRDLLYTSRLVNIAAVGTYGLVTNRVDGDVTLRARKTELQAKVTGTADSPNVRLRSPAVIRDVDPKRVERGLQELLRKFR